MTLAKRFIYPLTIIATLLFWALLFSSAVFAQDPACQPGGPLVGSSYCANQSSGTATNNEFVGPAGVINTVVTVLTMIAGVAAVIGVILGGFTYVTSSGDPSKTARAKDTIIYSIVGLIVAILARQIVIFILNRI